MPPESTSSRYSGMATAALVIGFLAAYGLRPALFYFGLAVIVATLGIAVAFTRETLHHTRREADLHDSGSRGRASAPSSSRLDTLPASGARGREDRTRKGPSFLEVFKLTNWGDRSLFAASQAGLVHKFTDALVWVSFPLFFRPQGLYVDQIGIIIGVYGFTWGPLQLVTGALTDRVGRKWPIVAGLLLCGGGIWLTVMVSGIAWWFAATAIIGWGMALLYPSLLVVVGNVSHPRWRGTSLGVYRMWRDSGYYAFGALLVGLISDTLGFNYGFYFTAVAMLASGAVVALWMYETAPAGEK